MSAEPLHLLIVEDEAAHVEAIRRAFEEAGTDVQIRAVDTLREFRACVTEQPPNLTLADLNLPDGQALEILTNPPEDAPFPVLVMTAFGNQHVVLDVMKAGALDYVVKSPESFAGMPQTVERVLREWNLLQRNKKMEAQSLRAQRFESIGTLAGGIAHDLNNVLAPILMAVEILREMITNEAGQKILSTLEASAQHGADLVKQVLAFARGIEGRRIMVNPIHLLHDIQHIVRDTFPKNITFSLVPHRDLWTTTGDPTQLHQVFTNLCVNARDAMPHGGRLTVTIENIVLDDVYADMNPDSKSGAYVMVEVTDTGTGIPPKDVERIFEPFFTTKEVGKGTGLGLSTTMAIVKSHGGFISVYSEIGKGTTFKVYLPADTTTKSVETAALERAQLPSGNGELVLVVDDEESIRSIAQATLERFGYRVLLATDGAEAVAVYAQHREEIAIVLTDLAMPVMDGASTLVALKALNPQVKAIASSGLTANRENTQAVKAGFEHFIPKPYTAELMLNILAKVLHEPA
ncbi:MAG: response regulator [Verrucomicrobiota bacterium]